MSTEYSHFTNLAFDRLFARGPDGGETLLINSSGLYVGPFSITGALTVTSLKVSTTASIAGNVSALNLSGTNTGNVTLGTANGLSLVGQVLSMTAASSSATGVVTTGTQSFAGTKTFVTPLLGSNVASASSSASGVVSTGAQSFAGAKTFTSNISAPNFSGTNTGDVTIGTANGLSLVGQALSMAAASSSTTGVITTGTQSIAGTKTFTTALAGSNVASASSSASGVVSTGAQSFAGAKTFKSAPIMVTGAINLGGNLRTSGSSSCTLTVTGTTAVTLPTSGTLATQAGSETLTNKTLTTPTINQPTINGVTDASSAGAGVVGQYMSSGTFSSVSAGTSGQFANMTSLVLTAGDWDIFFQAYADSNGASMTNQWFELVISANSGNTTTDHVLGDNRLLFPLPSGTTLGSGNVYWRRTINSTTTYYGKTKVTYTVATPQFAGKLWARRVR